MTSRRHLGSYVVIVSFMLLSASALAQEVNLTGPLTNSAAQKRTDALCRAANALADRDVETAETRRLFLRAVRTGAADTSCPADGLEALADAKEKDGLGAGTPTDRARALLKNGYATEADKELTGLIKAGPKVGDQPVALPDDLNPVARDFKAAQALADQGYDEQAQELVRAALTIDPDAEVPEDLVKGQRTQSWLRTIIGQVGTWIITIGVIGLGVLLAAMVVRLVVTHTRRRIVIEPFQGGGDGAGASILADMSQRLQRWGQGYGGKTALTASIGPQQGLTLPANVAGLVPNANVITDLLGAIDGLVPARRWDLAGHLLPSDPELGAGIALTVSRRTPRGVLAAETLREAEFQDLPDGDPDDDAKALAWQRLALPCAALVMFTDRSRRTLFRPQWRRLGTSEWRSFAMAASAAAFYKWEPSKARRLYRQAVALAPDYDDAQFGLAIVDLRLAGSDADQLDDVDRRLAALATSLRSDDPLWYKVRFWRVVVQLQRDTNDAGAGAGALSAALDLFDADEAKWWFDPGRLAPVVYLAKPGLKHLREFLDRIMPSTLAVLAAASTRANLPIGQPLAAKLRSTLGLSGSSPLTGAEIVGQLASRPELYGRAAYNLSCYYAENGQPAQALSALELALERGGPNLARFAWQDHFLQGLKATLADFKATLAAAGYEPPVDQPDLPDSP